MPHYLDILIAIPLLLAAYRGFKKGLVVELAGLAALILGIFAAMRFSWVLSDFIVEKWQYEGDYLPIVSFAGTFILVILAVHFIGKAIEKVLDLVALGMMNKLAGGFFNIAKAAIILSMVAWFANTWAGVSLGEGQEERGVLFPHIEGLAPMIMPSLLDGKWMEKVKGHIPEEISLPAQP